MMTASSTLTCGRLGRFQRDERHIRLSIDCHRQGAGDVMVRFPAVDFAGEVGSEKWRHHVSKVVALNGPHYRRWQTARATLLHR
jgi:hypothetical protein